MLCVCLSTVANPFLEFKNTVKRGKGIPPVNIGSGTENVGK